MTNKTKLSLEKENEPKQYLDDIFYINTEKPPTFASKVKSKLKKWAKPFGIGAGVYFGYLLVKKFAIIVWDLLVSFYNFCGSIFSGIWNTLVSWFDSISLFFLNTQTKPTSVPGTTVGDISNNLATSMADLLSSMAYLIGICFGIHGILALKHHNEDPEQVPLSKPITMIMVSAMLLALPSFLTVGSSVTFGNGTANVQTDSTNNILVKSTTVSIDKNTSNNK